MADEIDFQPIDFQEEQIDFKPSISTFGKFQPTADAIASMASTGVLGPNAFIMTQRGREEVGPILQTTQDILGIPANIIQTIQEQAQKIPAVKGAYELPEAFETAFGGATPHALPIKMFGKFISPEKRRELITGGISEMGGTLALTGLLKVAEKIPNIVSKLKIKDYAGNKVLAIRQGAKDYHLQEIKAYGNMLNDLGKEGKQNINPQPMLEKIMGLLKERGLYDPISGRWGRPFNSTDAQLLKSYEEIMRKLKVIKGRQIPISDIIDEYKAIRDSAGKFSSPTPQGRIARDTADDILNSIKDKIKTEEFLKGNKRYKGFKENMEALDKYFDIWGNPQITAKGERFLTRGLGVTKEARNIATIAKQKAGQTLKGAKTLSTINRIMRNPLARYGALGLAGGGAAGLGFRRFKR